MVRKILVPTDGSKASDNALAYAAEVAKMYKGELLVLQVVGSDVLTTYRQMDSAAVREKVMKEREQESKRVLGRNVNKVKKLGVKAEGIVRRGPPDKEIATLATERDDIVLIAMGAYGKQFLERQLVGSKTEGVLREMPELDVPLLVVPFLCKEAACKRVSDKTPKKILVPTDGSEASDNALAYAAEVAKLYYKAELLVLQVIRTGIVATLPHGISTREEDAQEIVEQSVNKAKKLGVTAEGIVRHGSPDEEIAALVSERDDVVLIVMGAYGKHFLERQLAGSQTEGVLRRLPHIEVPLIVVPRPTRRK